MTSLYLPPGNLLPGFRSAVRNSAESERAIGDGEVILVEPDIASHDVPSDTDLWHPITLSGRRMALLRLAKQVKPQGDQCIRRALKNNPCQFFWAPFFGEQTLEPAFRHQEGSESINSAVLLDDRGNGRNYSVLMVCLRRWSITYHFRFELCYLLCQTQIFVKRSYEF